MTLGAAALLGSSGLDGSLTRDESVYAYAGQQLSHRVPPYESIFDPKGPVAAVVAAIGAILGSATGHAELTGIRLVFGVVASLSGAQSICWLTGSGTARLRAWGRGRDVLLPVVGCECLLRSRGRSRQHHAPEPAGTVVGSAPGLVAIGESKVSVGQSTRRAGPRLWRRGTSRPTTG